MISPVEIRFHNRDAGGDLADFEEDVIVCDGRAAAIKIARWYSAWFASDDYDIFIDGVRQELSLNGHLDHLKDALIMDAPYARKP
jgi:hypothetical protein